MRAIPCALFALCAWLAPLAEAAAQTPPPAAARGLFWEARKGPARVYLMGTIHVGRPDFHPPPAAYMRRIEEAQAIALEANVFEARRVAAAYQKAALYPPDDAGLGRRLTDAQKARVTALANRFGLDPVQIWRLKPWALANTLIMLEAAQAGLSPAHATEAFLFQHATARGKPLLEIESIEAQLAIFDQTEERTQLAYLERTIDDIESGKGARQVRRIAAAWESGDADAMSVLLDETLNAGAPDERLLAQRLFVERHGRMVEAIERFAGSGRLHLVAVGTLHFFGPQGLLALLRARGYTITPLP
ncbi:MAG: TraB/GumN family protein [Burkholderiaceae bacterium]|nr:TraB/GumN family protein [Burkholderiaceae bacterium]